MLFRSQEEARTTKEDLEDASGEGEQECGIEKNDAMNRVRWRVGVGEIAAKMGVNLATSVYRDKPRSKLLLIEYRAACLQKPSEWESNLRPPVTSQVC